jgi:hypothetical protein
VQVFRRSPKSKEWGLGPKQAVQLPHVAGEPHQFTHVSWSHFGVDLVAIDRFGRILIWSTYTGALGRMIQMPMHIRDPEDACHSIIGLHWLPVLPTMQKVRLSLFICTVTDRSTRHFLYGLQVKQTSKYRLNTIILNM